MKPRVLSRFCEVPVEDVRALLTKLREVFFDRAEDDAPSSDLVSFDGELRGPAADIPS